MAWKMPKFDALVVVILVSCAYICFVLIVEAAQLRLEPRRSVALFFVQATDGYAVLRQIQRYSKHTHLSLLICGCPQITLFFLSSSNAFDFLLPLASRLICSSFPLTHSHESLNSQTRHFHASPTSTPRGSFSPRQNPKDV
jgi:hypothetical protein